MKNHKTTLTKKILFAVSFVPITLVLLASALTYFAYSPDGPYCLTDSNWQEALVVFCLLGFLGIVLGILPGCIGYQLYFILHRYNKIIALISSIIIPLLLFIIPWFWMIAKYGAEVLQGID